MYFPPALPQQQCQGLRPIATQHRCNKACSKSVQSTTKCKQPQGS